MIKHTKFNPPKGKESSSEGFSLGDGCPECGTVLEYSGEWIVGGTITPKTVYCPVCLFDYKLKGDNDEG